MGGDGKSNFRGIANDLAVTVFSHVVAQSHGFEQPLYLFAFDVLIQLPDWNNGPCCKHLLQGHFVERERAGFVRTDIGDRAQRLYSRQAPHQCILSHHAFGAQCQGNGDDRRQGFGYGRHRQGNGGQQHHQWFFATQITDGEITDADQQNDVG